MGPQRGRKKATKIAGPTIMFDAAACSSLRDGYAAKAVVTCRLNHCHLLTHESPAILTREFVEGFSKRKAERRKVAAARKALKEKEEKRRVRREKGEALKRQVSEVEAARLEAWNAAAGADRPREAAVSGKGVTARRVKEQQHEQKVTVARRSNSDEERAVLAEEQQEENSSEHVLQLEYFVPPPLVQGPPSNSNSTSAARGKQENNNLLSTASTGAQLQQPSSPSLQSSEAAATAAQHAPWLVGAVVKTTFGGF